MRLLVLVLIATFLSGCGDFRKPLGNDYFWLRTNYYNQVIFRNIQHEPYRKTEFVIDSKVIDVEVHGKYIVAFREEIDPEFYDGLGTIATGYGYHVINMDNNEVIRALSLSEIVELSTKKGFPLTDSMKKWN
ncbi:MAG: hypothetical protein AB8D52_06260 [Gammaproteobacteria bacterium]